jgi:hypothetical protein
VFEAEVNDVELWEWELCFGGASAPNCDAIVRADVHLFTPAELQRLIRCREQFAAGSYADDAYCA